jgi:F-type H+-transporting ATPase subunit beta
VVQQTGEGTVRCVAALERRHPAPGSSVRATGAGMLTPLRPAAVAGAMKVFAGTQERGGLVETGIKAVDLLCPYMQGGSVGLWGDIGAGELKLRTHPDDVGELPPDERGVWERARRVQNFLTQPMFMAEPYTKIPGRRVPLAQTLAGVKAILDGKADEVAEDSLLFVGALDDVKT